MVRHSGVRAAAKASSKMSKAHGPFVRIKGNTIKYIYEADNMRQTTGAEASTHLCPGGFISDL